MTPYDDDAKKDAESSRTARDDAHALPNAKSPSRAVVPDDGENSIRCCPACDSGRIQRSTDRNGATHDADWRCIGCAHTFDEPAERPAARSGGGRRGLAGLLANPEVTSVPDRDDEPATDGGGFEGEDYV